MTPDERLERLIANVYEPERLDRSDGALRELAMYIVAYKGACQYLVQRDGRSEPCGGDLGRDHPCMASRPRAKYLASIYEHVEDEIAHHLPVCWKHANKIADASQWRRDREQEWLLHRREEMRENPRRRSQPDRSGECVYVLRRQRDGMIKIGYSTNVTNRIRGLSDGHGELELLFTLHGDRAVEQALHERFQRHRRERREWFAEEGELKQWIKGKLPRSVTA